MNINMPAMLSSVIDIAEYAASEILKIYETDFSVDNKSDESPLTAADLASHNVITAGLTALTPGIPILSEESAAIAYERRRTWERYWLIDPLDGTREFVKRNGEFTVNIALIEHNEPVAGVVYVPVSKVCYFASKGHGAYKRMGRVPAEIIVTRKTCGTRLTVAGSRSHGSEQQQKFFTALGDKVEIISIGSSLKFCLVAEGKVDIYPRFGPTSEWDTAAAHAIVNEAGGIVTDSELQPLRYNCKDSLLNPHFLVIADPEFDWSSYLHKC